MADLTLPAELIEKLEEFARRENRSVEDLIASLLDERYVHPAYPYQMRAEDAEQREAILRADQIRLYDMARRYWRDIGDERQHMTDNELDEQFWLFDQDGIPRLRSEQGTLEVPENPLQSILDAISLNTSFWSFGDSARDVAARSREILNNEFADYLLARMKRPPIPRNE